MPNIVHIGPKRSVVAVDGGVVISPVPQVDIFPPTIPFTNVTYGEDMDQDGSAGDIDFEVAPPSGQIWYVQSVTLGLDDVGSLSPDDYGSITSVVNGTKFILDKNTVEHVMRTMVKNTDISHTFNGGVGIFNPGGFLDSTKTFIGKKTFIESIKLNGSLGDRLILRVQDDLTGLQWHRAAADVFQIL